MSGSSGGFMKKLLVGLLVLASFSSSFASCLDLYKARAKKRNITRKVLVRSGQVVGGIAGVVGLGSVLAATIGGDPFGYVFAAGITGATVFAPLEASLQDNNRFEKLIGAIEFFNKGKLHYKNDDVAWLMEKISKRMNFYSLDDQITQEIKKEIPIIVLDMNQSKDLCPVYNGENKALNVSKVLSSIVSRINEVFPNIDDYRTKDVSWTCSAQKDFFEGKIYSATADTKIRAKNEARDLCELEENVKRCKKIITCKNNLTGITKFYGVMPQYLNNSF